MPSVPDVPSQPGRRLTDFERRYARLLLDIRERAYSQGKFWEETTEDLILELREDGCSARSLADELGVAFSTVQKWTTNARRRRE